MQDFKPIPDHLLSTVCGPSARDTNEYWVTRIMETDGLSVAQWTARQWRRFMDIQDLQVSNARNRFNSSGVIISAETAADKERAHQHHLDVTQPRLQFLLELIKSVEEKDQKHD